MHDKKDGRLKENHKIRKGLVILDKILIVICFFGLLLFKLDLFAISIWFLIFPYLILTKRKGAIAHLLVASFLAIVWMIIARKEYYYNQEFVILAGINLFPLFSWAMGLFAVYLIYSHWEHKIKSNSFIRKTVLFLAFYWPLLILAETMGYYILEIRNIATSVYPGLPICNCMHAPPWMQISYFLLGPIYFFICQFAGLENPHK